MHQEAEEQGVKSALQDLQLLASSLIVCCACAAGYTLHESQAQALMPHLMTLDWDSITHVGACNIGQMAWNTLHNAGRSSHQCCQLKGILSNLSTEIMYNEQVFLSEATNLLSMLS